MLTQADRSVAQVERVSADATLEVDHRAALAIVSAVISHRAHRDEPTFFTVNHLTSQAIAAGTALLFCVFASMATYGLAGKARELLEPKMGASHAAIVRYALLLVGAFTTLVVTLVTCSACLSPSSSSAAR